jgi:hypothetical protein
MHEYIAIFAASLCCIGGGACYIIKRKNDRMRDSIALIDINAYERIRY